MTRGVLPSVAIVLPVRHDDARFSKALEAIGRASPAPDEVVVVLDGPVPGAAERVRRAGFASVVRPRSGGPAAARNTGARATRADVLLFVDADVAIAPDLIARVRERMADPSVAAAVGCYDERPPEPNFFSRYKNLLQRFVHLEADAEGSTFWGACGAIRRRAFFDAGGFDERFDRPSVEDIDLGYRLRARGGRIVFDPALEITHLKRWTLTSLVRSDVMRRALPWTWLMMREARLQPDLNLRYSSRIAGALSVTLFVSLAAALVDGRALAIAGLAAVGLATIDRRLFGFFREHGGMAFAVAATAWHWVYYLYSTLAFGAAILLYPVVGRRLVGSSGAPSGADRKGSGLA